VTIRGFRIARSARRQLTTVFKASEARLRYEDLVEQAIRDLLLDLGIDEGEKEKDRQRRSARAVDPPHAAADIRTGTDL
jgi:hypothetical protein